MLYATCTSCQSRCPVRVDAEGFSCPHCGTKHYPIGAETGIARNPSSETGITADPDLAPDYPPWAKDKMLRRRPARWNVVSVVMALLGLPVGILFCVLFFELGKGILWGSHPMEMIAPIVYGWGACCVFGLVAAVIAWLRAERWWGLTAVGFILNAMPLAIPAWTAVGFILSALPLAFCAATVIV